MATYTLTGNGTQALSVGTTALHCHFSTLPKGLGEGSANPPSFYQSGFIRAGDGTAWWRPWPLHAQDTWLGLFNGVTQIGYSILGGGVLVVTEVIGGSFPFQSATPSIEQLTDVAIAAVSDGQVLEWVAADGKWENRTPASAGGSSTVQQLTTYSVTTDQPNVSLPGTQAWTDLPWSQFSITVPSGVKLALVVLRGMCMFTGSLQRVHVRAVMDGVGGVPFSGALNYVAGDFESLPLSGTFDYWNLSAAAHTFKLQAKADAAETLSLQPASQPTQYGFAAAVYGF